MVNQVNCYYFFSDSNCYNRHFYDKKKEKSKKEKTKNSIIAISYGWKSQKAGCNRKLKTRFFLKKISVEHTQIAKTRR